MAHSKYKEAEARNRLARNISRLWQLFLLLVGVGLLVTYIFFPPQDKGNETPAKKTALEVRYDMPPFEPLTDTARKIPARQWLDDAEMQESMVQAIELVVEMKTSPELATSDDQTMFALLDHYKTHPGEMRIGPANAATRDGVGLNFNCSEKKYTMGRKQLPVALLANLLYHEMHHDAVCQGLITRYGVMNGNPTTENRCRIEAPAYAAEVRFFLAIHHRGQWPAEIGWTEGFLTVFERTRVIWRKLLDNQFCGWLDEQYRN